MKETILEHAIKAYDFFNEETDYYDFMWEETHKDLGEIVKDFFEVKKEYFPEITEKILAEHAPQFGHDLYLTCGGHGAGFWDGDWDLILSDKTIQALCKWCEAHRLN